MKEILEKISSYNLFNYLLPGMLFATLAEKSTTYSFIQDNIIVGVFLYYFIGLVVSRIGSLIVEPVLKAVTIIKFAEYNSFVAASKKDEKIELLSEINNTYRTLCSLFVLLLTLKLYEKIESWYPVLKEWNLTALFALLLVIFLLSYKKQTNYIDKSIKANLSG